MAKRTFSLNTEPHEAEVDGTTLYFRPELLGTELVESYEKMQAEQEEAGEGGNLEAMRASLRSAREFLASLMTDESAELFLTIDVLTADNVVAASFTDPAQARVSAASLPGAKVRDRVQASLRLLLEISEWIVGLHGGGTGASARPTGRSAAS